ncbi:MAG: tetratricopeptide repeat protein, partial [Planctomycetes bacterium]|nr:tetratricopeptide repeat protein [Planctomycetota bacterium]
RRCRFPPLRKIKPAVPAALEAICLKAMAAEPDDRYQSAKELGEEITRWQSGRPVNAYPEPWLDRAERFVREHRAACLSTAAALLVLVLAAGAWRLHSWQRIETVAAGARALVSDGQQAFNDGRIEAAKEKFTQAMGQASVEPSLAKLQSEIQTWIGEVQQRIDNARAAETARTTLRNFERLHDDALFFGTLLGGYDVQQSIERAKRSATEALALFAVRVDSNDRPQLGDLPYSDQEQQSIVASCRRLRMVLADAEAQLAGGASQEDRRAAAGRALAILDYVDVGVDAGDRPLKALHLRRALYLAQAGDKDAARIERQRAANIQPADAHDHVMVGDFHYRNQDYTQAIRQFQHALRKSPEHFWAQYYLGVAHLRLKHWSEAIASFNASVSPRDDFVYIYTLRGLAYGEMGDLAAAEADFARAAELDPDEYGIYINRGIVRLRHHRVKQAANDFRIAIGHDKQQPAGYLNLAEALRLQGMRSDALAELDHCIEVSPTSARAFHAMAIIHGQQNKLDETLTDLNEAGRWARSGSMLAAQIHADRGKVLHRQKKYEQAFDEYRAAQEERPDFHLALVLQGIDLMDMAAVHAAKRETQEARDDRRAAIDRFDRFLANSPLVNQAYQSADTTGAANEDDAPEVLPATISPARLLAIVYRERGIARNLVGEVSPAMDDFARAMELLSLTKGPPTAFERSRYRNLRMRRGWAYLLRFRQLAMADFNAAIKEDPNDAEPYTGRGYAWVKLGDYQKATRDADRAVLLKSKNPGVYFNAAGIYAQAIPLVLADKTAEDRDQQAKTYGARALDHLRTCLKMSTQRQQQFYLRQIGQDDALDPIRTGEALRRLTDEFSQ